MRDIKKYVSNIISLFEFIKKSCTARISDFFLKIFFAAKSQKADFLSFLNKEIGTFYLKTSSTAPFCIS